MALYRCPACKIILERPNTGATQRNRCGAFSREVRLKRISEDSSLNKQKQINNGPGI